MRNQGTRRKSLQRSLRATFLAFVCVSFALSHAVLAFDDAGAARAPEQRSMAAAQYTFRLPVSADAEVNTHDRDKNYGDGDEVKVLADSGGDHFHRPLFRYDLGSVLPGSAVITATAHFYVRNDDANPVEVHAVTRRWDEDTITWNTFAEGYLPAATSSFVPAQENRFYAVDITDLAGDWLAGGLRNRGLALLPAVEKKDSKYATREDAELGRHSYLEVTVENSALYTFADDFIPTAYTGSDGSDLWAPAWQELGEGDGAGLGAVQVVNDGHCPGGACLKIGETNASLTGLGVSRQVDLSNAVAATLSFSYAREDANALLHVEVSKDGGANWHRLDSIPLEHNDSGFGYESYDISAYLAANTSIRFLGEQTGGINDKGVFVDDVYIAYLDSSALDSGIGDRVWDDLNRDGVQDGGEPGIADVRLDLYTGLCGDAEDPAYRTTTTDAGGAYQFPILFAGNYCVVVDERTLPPGYGPSGARSPLDVTLNTSQVITDADFSFASVLADTRLTVGAFAPCTDIAWLQAHALAHNAVFVNQDYEACSFTLEGSAADIAALQLDVEADLNRRRSGPDVYTSGSFTPNDPDYNNPSKVYGPQQIHAEQAWDITQGDPSLIVAVVDTGVDPTHPELAGRLLPGWDFANGDDDPNDDNGHGTHIAGIIAAAIDNGIGIAGIAGSVQILPVKVLDANNSGWWSDVADGITWAVDQGARVINLSLTGSVDSYALQDAVSYALTRGAVVVVAAGNSSSNTPYYPASYDNVLSLGATTYTGTRWTLSNYGPNVDAMAPGATIWSTYPGGGYRFMSGTSMAAPHAAGLAALLLSIDPNLHAGEIKQVLLDTATDLGDSLLHGAGLIDAAAATAAVQPTAYTPPQTSMETQLVADLSDNGIVDPGDIVRYTLVVANEDAAPLSNVVVSGTLPAHTTYVLASTRLNGIPTQDHGSGTPFPLDAGGMNIGTVPANNSTFVSFDVTVDAPLPPFYSLYSQVTVDDGSGQQAVDATTDVGGEACSLALSNAGGAPISSLNIGADLYITLADPDQNTRPGTVQHLPLTVHNPATGDSEIVVLAETGVDTGVFEGSIQLSKALGQAPQDGLLHTTAPGQNVQVSYTDPDFLPDHCEGAVAALAAGAADLRVTHVVSDNTPDEGQSLVYTVKVKNNGGPDVASSVVISDPAPAGIDFITGSATHGSFDYEHGEWHVGRLPVGVEATLIVDAEVSGSSGETLVATAAVEAIDQDDAVVTNDAAGASVTVNPADLRLQLGVDDSTPDEGQTLLYTVKVKNQGPAALASGIVVSDVLPPGLTFVSSTAQQGSYDSGTGLWALGNLASGVEVALTLNAAVDAGTSGQTLHNRAQVFTFDQADILPDNDSAAAPVTVNGADIIVGASVDESSPGENQIIVYTVSVKNNGPAALASGLVISSLLPAGLEFLSAAPEQGSYDEGGHLWSLGALASGATKKLAVTARVRTGFFGQTLIYTARLAAVDQFELDEADNLASQAIDVVHTDIKVLISIQDNSLSPGQLAEYTVEAKQNGPADNVATGVVLSVPLPPNLSFEAASAEQGSYDPGTGLWQVGDLARGVTRKLVISAQVLPWSPPASSVVVAAALAGLDQHEQTPANNGDDVAFSYEDADIKVALAVNNPTPDEGDIITYTLSAENLGPANPAGFVAVQNILPPGLTFLSAAPGQGSYDPASGVWEVGTLPKSDARHPFVVHLDLQASVDAGTNGLVLDHSATLVPRQPDPAAANDSASAPITVRTPDIQIDVSVDDATPDEGQTLTFTVSAAHIGPANPPATGVRVRDLLPAGLDFVGALPGQGSYDPSSGVWDVGSIARDAVVELVLQATVAPGTSGTTLSNEAALLSLDQQDLAPANDVDQAPVAVNTADLRLTHRVSEPAPAEEQLIHYTVHLRNGGPSFAAHIVVADLLPPGLTFKSWSASQGSYDANTGHWSPGTLAAGAAAELVLEAQVNGDSGGQFISHSAAVLSFDQVDPNPANDSALAAIVVQKADIRLSQTVSDALPDEGDVILYTVTARNLGPSPATGVVVADLLPAGLRYVGHAATQGSYDAASGFWVAGDLAVEGEQTLQISARVQAGAAGQHIGNSAALQNLDQPDPQSDNDSATTYIDVRAADLRVQVSANDSTPAQGQGIALTIKVKNQGPAPASGVVVAARLPFGLSYLSAAPEQGSYEPTSGLWALGDLAKGVERALVIEGVVDDDTAARTIAVRAGVFAVDQADVLPANNVAGVDLVVAGADLALSKVVNDPTPDEGQVIYYEITLANQGPDNASNVRVIDHLPAGLSYLAHSGGNYNPASGVWTVPALASGASVLLSIEAQVNAGTRGQVIANHAAIATADQPDALVENNYAEDKIAVGDADLQLVLAVDKSTPGVGEVVQYSVQVQNAGPDPASSLRVAFTLPPGLSYIGDNSGGAYDPATGIWKVGLLAPPAALSASSLAPAATSAILTVDAGIAEGAAPTLAASASILGADQNDPDAGNNQDAAGLNVLQADLSLALAVNGTSPQIGDAVVYTLTLTNAGPDAATGIAVTDLLPAPLIYDSAAASAGSYDPASGVWSVASLDPFQTATLTLSALLAPGPESTIVHRAEIMAVDQPDGDSSAGNHDPNEDDQAEIAIFSGQPPLVDGVLDPLYELAPDVERVCYSLNSAPLATLYVLPRPAEGAVYAALVLAREVVDNSYGAHAVAWPGGHSFSQLLGSDSARFLGYDGSGLEVLNLRLDYLSAGLATPSGHGSAGVIEGDGGPVLAWGTSLAHNLNDLGYCTGGECDLLAENLFLDSPATDAAYTPNPTYPAWLFDVVYELKIDAAAFGAAGFASLAVPAIHASPSKVGADTLITTPGPCPGQIGDLVWYDRDGDGLVDGGEPGLDGVDLNLYRDGGDGFFSPGSDLLVDSATTAGGGRYRFDDVTPGVYFVQVVGSSLPAYFSPSAGSTVSGPLSLANGESSDALDFGFAARDFGDAPGSGYPTLAASNGACHVLDGLTYLGAVADEDADGQQDLAASGDDNDGGDDEEGIVFTSTLRRQQVATLAATATRPGYLSAWIDFNGDGDWSDAGEQVFADLSLVAGVNPLQVLVPADAALGASFARFRFSSQTGLGLGGQAEDGEVEDYLVEIDAPVGGASGAARIGDLVWDDRDGDGVQDAGEPGLSGVLVRLTDFLGVTNTTVTFAGNYEFPNLPAGTYTLTLDAASFPAGYSLSTTPTSRVVDLPPDAVEDGADFGLAQPATIGDFAFFDLDGDGQQEPGESVGVASIPITLTHLGSGTTSVVLTVNGWYSFTGLLPGTYQVSAPPSGPGIVLTSPAAADVTLSGGESRLDIDFGYITPTAVTLASLTVSRDEDFVTVAWRASDEQDIEGYVVWRAPAEKGPYKPVSGLIPAYNKGESHYTWQDAGLHPDATYWYKLQTWPGGQFFGPVGLPPEPGGNAHPLFIPYVTR